jgi:hypothetical protein
MLLLNTSLHQENEVECPFLKQQHFNLSNEKRLECFPRLPKEIKHIKEIQSSLQITSKCRRWKINLVKMGQKLHHHPLSEHCPLDQ